MPTMKSRQQLMTPPISSPWNVAVPNCWGRSRLRGLQDGLCSRPFWKVSLIDETVDVASSGDFAVYRGTYNEDNGRTGVVMTHKTNFLRSSSAKAIDRGESSGTAF